MKTTNKSGGKPGAAATAILFSCLLYGCITNSCHSVVNKDLANIIATKPYAEYTDSFNMVQDGYVHIHSVGELQYYFAESPLSTWFRGDDISIFINKIVYQNGDTLHLGKRFYFTLSDNKEKNAHHIKISYPGGIKVRGIQIEDSIMNRIVSAGISEKIHIPWKNFIAESATPITAIGLNIVCGDTDNEFAQKAQVSLCNMPDTSQAHNNDHWYTLIKNYRTALPVNMDTSKTDACWQQLNSIPIQHILWGVITDKQDYQAFVKIRADINGLCFLFSISDYSRRRIFQKDIAKTNTMADYSLIKNYKGDTIYMQSGQYSVHAGGAFKNRVSDTILLLKKGRYYVTYISDESHYTGNWDAAAPENEVYGVRIYPASGR